MKLQLKVYHAQNQQGSLTVSRWISGPNLVILAWRGDKLLYRQAQNGIILDLHVKFDLEDQGQSTPKTIGFLTVLRYISGLNLVILIWTGEKLSCGQSQNEGKFVFQVKFDLESQGRSYPKNNRHLNQGVLYLWSKFGDSSLNGWGVIVRTNKWLIHTHTDRHTDAGDDNTQRPKTGLG